ncbi:MAG TPA: hypothetical protein GX715_00560 [Armatimonadetes bacterium]|nr:hypothetical protein [Armatimonadota bacterium]
MARKTSKKTGSGKERVPPGPAGTPVSGRDLLRERPAWLVALLAVYFVLGGLYLATVPFGHAPDESAHLLYVEQLASGQLPVFRAEDRANFEAHQPPLAYLVALPAYLLAGGEGDAARYAVRLVSLVLGAVVIWLVAAAVRLWLPGQPGVALAAGAVAAFMPMRLAVFSSFSNDPLTETLFCAVLFLLGLGLCNGFDRRRCLWVGALIGLGLLTKTTCILLLPVALVALFLEWRRHRSRAREYLANAGLLAGLAVAIGLPWMARNVVLYGDPFAWKAFEAFFGDRATPEYWMTRQGLSFRQYIFFWVPAFTIRSFWGVFDHMNLWMGGPVRFAPPEMKPHLIPLGTPDAPIYLVLTRVAQLLGVGAVVAGIRWWRGKPEAWQRDIALAWGLCAALIVAAFFRFNTQYYQAQARYLYPAVLPIAATMAAGWLVAWPERLRRVGALLGAALLAGLAIYAWHGTLLRVFGGVGW